MSNTKSRKVTNTQINESIISIIMLQNKYDVLIIGAGPSGTIAAALLKKKGYHVGIIEASKFPRFSIGESLLPQCMMILEKAGLLTAVQNAHFQCKNGAVFEYQKHHTAFNFEDKFTPGWDHTFQVERAKFDKILADEVEKNGVEIYYQQKVVDVDVSAQIQHIKTIDQHNVQHQYQARFILDASGFARVLPKLLDLDCPSDFPPRMSLFTHIKDNIKTNAFDRNKILITVHPQNRNIWFWLIPFQNNKASIGVVAESRYLLPDIDPKTQLKKLVYETPGMSCYLQHANWSETVQSIHGFSSNVKSLYGQGFALLGNAGEFLDPVFSSGVTIAMKSAELASTALDKQLRGQKVDWEKDFAKPLQFGVNTFKAYVNAWYNHDLQDIIFAKTQPAHIKQKICAVLAGYAWDSNNDYTVHAQRKLARLAQACRQL
ncbi:NAD(P)/FAD-dependent oxidoreductase [Facilibium subflavum]|uniref:NAD(P)/FAD-dependent oxidoreductase n=1 Tax=Facilibium subflavum TaxID=2219058 RepID=UPI001F41BABD|nr:NAD(P)/FAD-dependent oxidoreductase [Facilibium subflavum]